jgi:hypothetical protein
MTPQRRVIAIAFAVLPIAFGIFRALQTRNHDLRMLWMAIAATAGAMIVRAIVKKHAAIVTFIVATLLAGATAHALGATAWFGVWAVAIVLGGCWAISTALSSSVPESSPAPPALRR